MNPFFTTNKFEFQLKPKEFVIPQSVRNSVAPTATPLILGMPGGVMKSEAEMKKEYLSNLGLKVKDFG